MADVYDGSIKIDTSIDLDRLTKELKKMNDLAAKTAGDIKRSFSQNKELDQMVKDLDRVNAQIEVQQKLLEDLREKYERVASVQGVDSPEALKLQKQILAAEQSIDKMIQTSDRMAESIRQMDAEMEGAAAAAQSLGQDAADLERETSKAEKTTDLLGETAKGVFQAFGVDISDAVDKAKEAFDEYKDKSEGMGDDFDGVATAMGAALAGAMAEGVAEAIEKLVDLGKAALETASEVEYAGDRMQAALGLSEEEAADMSRSVHKVYREGLGKDREEIEKLATTIRSQMDAEGQALEYLTSRAAGLGAAFGDAEGIVRTAGIMMNAFGITGMEAFDILAHGFQNGADAGGDFLDSMADYAATYDRMGLSANRMLADALAGMDAGTQNVDRALNINKELFNNVASGSETTAAALDELGFSSQQVYDRILKGGPVLEKTYSDIADRLLKVSDETDQARLASEIFGTTWEDTSTDVIRAVASAKSGTVEVMGTAESAYQTMIDNMSTHAEESKRFMDDVGRVMLAFWVNQIFPTIMSGLSLIDEARSKFSVGIPAPTSNLAKYAVGTRSAPGGMSWVGENGPELVQLPLGSRVYTATQSMAMAAAKAPSQTNYYDNRQTIMKVDDIETYVQIKNKEERWVQSMRMGYVGR